MGVEAQFVAPGEQPVDRRAVCTRWRRASPSGSPTSSRRPGLFAIVRRRPIRSVLAAARVRGRRRSRGRARQPRHDHPLGRGGRRRCRRRHPGTVDETNPKVVRASAGALFHVPVVAATLADVAAAGLRLIGSSSHRGTSHTAADWSGRIAIVAGNEAAGLDDDDTDRRVGAHRAPRPSGEPQRGDGDDGAVLRGAAPARRPAGRRRRSDDRRGGTASPAPRGWSGSARPRRSRSSSPWSVRRDRLDARRRRRLLHRALRDVLTAHHPLSGRGRRARRSSGSPVNNLGPLQLDVLAPFTKVSPVPRHGGRFGADQRGERRDRVVRRPADVPAGGRRRGDGRHDAVRGHARPVVADRRPAAVRHGAAVLRPAVAQRGDVGGRGASPSRWRRGRQPRSCRRTSPTPTRSARVRRRGGRFVRRDVAARSTWKPVAGVVARCSALCWIQPLIDEFAGTGNLGEARARPGSPATWCRPRAGVQVVAGAALVPPFWLPASMRTFLLPDDGISLPRRRAAAVGAGCSSPPRSPCSEACRSPMAVGAGVASASPSSPGGRRGGDPGVVVRARAPELLLGVGARRLRLAVAAGAACARCPPRRSPLRSARRRRRRSARRRLVGRRRCRRVAALPGRLGRRRRGRGSARRSAAATSSLRPSTRGLVDDDVEVDLVRAFFANDYPYVMLAELQRRDRVPLRAGQPQPRPLRRVALCGGRPLRAAAPHLRPDPELAPGASSSPRWPASPTTSSPSTAPCNSASATCCATARSRSTARRGRRPRHDGDRRVARRAGDARTAGRRAGPPPRPLAASRLRRRSRLPNGRRSTAGSTWSTVVRRLPDDRRRATGAARRTPLLISSAA